MDYENMQEENEVMQLAEDPAVDENWLRDFKTGIAMGLCLSSQFESKAEPIAYLYGHVAKEGETPTHTINGVDYVGAVLPDINAVWTDREKYPFAVVLDWTKSEFIGYALYLLDGIPCVVDGETTVLNVTTSKTYGCTFDEESASKEGVQIAEWFFAGSHEPSDYGDPFNWFGEGEMWVSHSVYYKSGKIAMEAIPPIPVYE